MAKLREDPIGPPPISLEEDLLIPKRVAGLKVDLPQNLVEFPGGGRPVYLIGQH